MQINQNIAAFNAYRNLSTTQDRLGSSLEKLSSGFRINRAADDAAGLVNSENLRSQIGGLQVATRNAQDAISLVQTAEGAQTEVHSILQRMRDLAVQSGNLGTNDSVALNANQQEINELVAELDRIAGQTQFGTQAILDGSLGAVEAEAVDIAAAVTETAGTDDGLTDATFTLDVSDLQAAADWGDAEQAELSLDFANGDSVAVVVAEADFKDDGQLQAALQAAFDAEDGDYTVAVDGGEISITAVADADGDTFSNFALELQDDQGDPVTGNDLNDAEAPLGALDEDIEAATTTTATEAAVELDLAALAGIATEDGLQVTLDLDGDEVTFALEELTTLGNDAEREAFVEQAIASVGLDVGAYDVVVDGDDLTVTAAEVGEADFTATATDGTGEAGAVFQVGANDGQTVNVAITGVSAEQLGIDEIDVTTSAGVDAAIQAVDGAIGDVSANRAELGAFQNRMESTIRNISVAVENLSAAESRIRDTDMALEMVEFTRNQILQQAGTAMLAQANMVPQSVLSLL